MWARRARAARLSRAARDRSCGRPPASAAWSPPHSGRIEQGCEHTRELRLQSRLADIVVGAGSPDLEHPLLVVVTAHGDDREIRRGGPQALRRLDAVDD